MPAYTDFMSSRRFQSALAVSPDGNLVAYADDTSGQFNLVVQSADGGPARQVTTYSDNRVTHVSWHPDGRSLLFYADTKGDDQDQPYLVDVDAGEPRRMTPAPTNGQTVRYMPAVGHSFSPDGRWVAYAANDRSSADQDVLVTQVETGVTRRLYAEGGRAVAGHWSPDGCWLTAVDRIGGVTNHVVYLLEVGTGHARRLTPPDGSAAYWLGPWLPDGSGFVVMTDQDRDFIGLAAMDAKTGELSWLDMPDWDVEDVVLSRDGRRLVWSVNADGAFELRCRDLQTGAHMTMPDLLPGVFSTLDITVDGQHAVALMSTPTTPENVVSVDLDTGVLHWLTDARPPAAASVQFVEPTLIHLPTPAGHTVPAWLYRPLGATEPVGVVVAIHGGPALQERASYSLDGFLQYLVAQGVAVLAPNVRGSSGYGTTYLRQSYRDWGGKDLEDLAAATRYLQSLPWVDPARVGLTGRSYGGFAVLSGIARLPEFNWAAAVAWCGPSNLVTFARAQPPSWRSKVETMIGNPDTDADFLLSRSPISYADNIKTPLLIIQGANDTRVPQHESDQIIASLRRRGVEVRYDVYPDEGHVFGKRENQIKALVGASEFLLAHLAR